MSLISKTGRAATAFKQNIRKLPDTALKLKLQNQENSTAQDTRKMLGTGTSPNFNWQFKHGKIVSTEVLLFKSFVMVSMKQTGTISSFPLDQSQNAIKNYTLIIKQGTKYWFTKRDRSQYREKPGRKPSGMLSCKKNKEPEYSSTD